MDNQKQKVGIISGARGQDASYLAELLLEKGYKVVAVDRRISSPDYCNIKHLVGKENYILEDGDVTDFGSIVRLVNLYKPDEFYNLAAQSFVAASWSQPLATEDVNFNGVGNCLEAIRLCSPTTKFFQASTSEVYGDVTTDMQDEDTPARPRSPYAAAKYGAESLVKVYRDSYGLFACYARSFNHESPRRGKEFVTRKITDWIGRSFNLVEHQVFNNAVFKSPIKELKTGSKEVFTSTETAFSFCLEKGYIEALHLGNLDAKRDWSHAKDTVRGIWMMMQQDKPDDFVLASGETYSIRDFLSMAFAKIGITDWEKYIVIDEKFFRPADVNLLCGNYYKAKNKLDWSPTISLKDLIAEMVENDINLNTK